MEKITNIAMSEVLEESSSNMSNLKRRNPKKYEIVKLGVYLYQANIKEDELLPLLEIYNQMRSQIKSKDT